MVTLTVSSGTIHDEPLLVRAQSLFPHRPYLESSNVTHNQKGWVRAVWYLRNSKKWQSLYNHDSAANK